MRLTPEVKRVLRGQVETMTAAINRLHNKIEALNDILREDEAPGNGHQAPLPSIMQRPVPRGRPDPGQLFVKAGTGTGLRAMIVSIIRDNPGSLRPFVIQRVDQIGFNPKGKTPLDVLVTSELYRLAKVGILRRENKKFYPGSMEG